uniref:Uncharacterized protein n=1 Tax=uncultured marine virus TaxID=186617 RepID=A0A0F7L681_9VIRU|nr:hypothetical protein [uncultured marine virus]
MAVQSLSHLLRLPQLPRRPILLLHQQPYHRDLGQQVPLPQGVLQSLSFS